MINLVDGLTMHVLDSFTMLNMLDGLFMLDVLDGLIGPQPTKLSQKNVLDSLKDINM